MARRSLLALPLLFLLGFAAVYVVAACTPFGQTAENSLVRGFADQARILALVESVGPPPLKAAMPTLVAGTALIAAVAAVRRCWWQGCAALAVVVTTVGGTQVLRMVLPRPDLVHAPQNLIEASFPSGHVAIAAGLAFGAILVASPRARPYIAAAGMLWLAVTAAAVQTLCWHRPSDAIGATLLGCACYCLATRSLPAATTAGGTVCPRALPAIALALAAAGAAAASTREDSVMRPLVFAAAALLCAALLWITVAKQPAPPAPGAGPVAR
ncbi:phosphatase PAP2 family protein [Streptomyces sp. YGL11-2]|uniref:phosphatase PAP2 family protein n=1 Tax=Streptomyces sp. YGL11-2 TaxID=3414028 RepID=UPI003CF5FF21